MKSNSRARDRYFDYLESQGKIPKKQMMDEDGYAYGGEVKENFDVLEGEAHDYDSAGEPHTSYKFQDEEPMEFNDHGEIENYDDSTNMYEGGKVKRMSRGGMVPHPNFAKALRRSG